METNPNKTGKVYFVGAGPSDPGLITLKGLRVLQQAQTVIYDALIGPGIYHMISADAEKIPVGKRAGRHCVKQEEINKIILRQAQMGRRVVRLKGGDPFLFGRGGEELELLVSNQIPYEIVPGVTSAIAVPAYAGIPVTYRAVSSSLHILTGHRKQNEPLDIDFKALQQAGGTYVFLMGMSSLHEIANGFLQAGMRSDMPAAVISQGTGARQQSVLAELSVIEEKVNERRLEAPGTIVIGEVAAYAKRFAWREHLPLSKSRIIVTRPAPQNGSLTERLRELGAEVLEMPAIQTVIRDCGCQLRAVLSDICKYNYMVFTSPAGVDYFFELLDQLELDVRCIGAVKIAVIGPATGKALKKRGLRPERMPDRYNSEALGKLLNESVQTGDQVLLLRSAWGSKELIAEIQNGKQVEITDLAIYDTVYAKGAYSTFLSEEMDGADFFADGFADMVMFTSASTVRGFVQMTEGADYTKICAVCIGQKTAEQAFAYHMRVYKADEETIESMVDAAVRLHMQQQCTK